MTYSWIIVVGIIYLLHTVILCEARTQPKLPEKLECPKKRWSCGGVNPQCISKYLVCDGIADCSNKADETLAVCGNYKCPPYAYRCAYGACVDGNAPCDGEEDCLDGSDELLECNNNKTTIPSYICKLRDFRCSSGQCISDKLLCDGIADCQDGSDETNKCLAAECPSHTYRCDYGACIEMQSKCDGIANCHDGSDESPKVCGKPPILPPLVPATPPTISFPTDINSNDCVVPNDTNVRYILLNTNQAQIPGMTLKQFSVLRYKCVDGLVNMDAKFGLCKQGNWDRLPRCTKFCKIRQSATYDIKCYNSDNTIIECLKIKPHEEIVPSGAKVVQICEKGYAQQSNLYIHTCQEDGEFDISLTPCVPVCGSPTSNSKPLEIKEQDTNMAAFPWHAVIYFIVEDKPPIQKCGGTIINAITILSAAHCFSYVENGTGIEKLYPKERFVVAVGKIYNDWNATEPFMQHSLLANLEIPQSYNGAKTNYADDIAVLFLKSPITFNKIISPVCVDWSLTFFPDESLSKIGKIAVWGSSETGEEKNALKWISVHLAKTECEEFVPDIDIDVRSAFIEFQNGPNTWSQAQLYRGDSGSGFSSPIIKGSKGIYYINRIVSNGVENGTSCNPYKKANYTKVHTHINWLIEVGASRGIL